MKKLIVFLTCISVLTTTSLVSFVSADNIGKTESKGIYNNDFDDKVSTDFNIYYDGVGSKDKANYGYNDMADITVDSSEFFTSSNGRLERVQGNNERFTDYNRPHWAMAYYTYKNQAFRDFTLEVDAYMPGGGDAYGANYNLITIGDLGKGYIDNKGFTLGFQYKNVTTEQLWLGKSASFNELNNGGGIIDSKSDGYRLLSHDSKNFNYKIKIYVRDGKATISINNTEVYKDYEVGEVSGYISLCNGPAGGSYYDNLKISELPSINLLGKYENRFNDGKSSEYNVYYDSKGPKDSVSAGYNDMNDITTNSSEFFTSKNEKLERVQGKNERFADYNRSYWNMAYYTYKNQTFRDFTLEVDAYMPGGNTTYGSYGANYNLITVGDLGKGYIDNNGFTLGFHYATLTNEQLWLGKNSEASTGLNNGGGAINTASKGYKLYTHDSGNFNYKIKIDVKDGKATVSINNTEVYKDYDVGNVAGYISFCNGPAGGSYYDNIKITSAVSPISLSLINGSIISAKVDNIKDASNMGFNVSVKGTDSKEYSVDFDQTSNIKAIFKATDSGVYYVDVNNDSVIDTSDLVTEKEYLLQKTNSVNKKAADCNSDNIVDIRDLVCLNKVLKQSEVTVNGDYAIYVPELLKQGNEVDVTPYIINNGYKLLGASQIVK